MKIINWLVIALIAGLAALFVLPAPGPPVVDPPVIVDPVHDPENFPPVIFGRPGWPMMSNTMAGWNDTVRFDANQRGDCAAVNCDDRCLDISDPEGDPLLFKWEFYGPDVNGVNVAYTVFDPSETNITGEWTANRLIGIVIGFSGAVKPRPLLIMSCGPTPLPPDITPPDQTANMQCKLSVWDGVNDPVAVRWRQLMTLSGCGG